MHSNSGLNGMQAESLRELDYLIMIDIRTAIVEFKNMFGGIVRQPVKRAEMFRENTAMLRA